MFDINLKALFYNIVFVLSIIIVLGKIAFQIKIHIRLSTVVGIDGYCREVICQPTLHSLHALISIVLGQCK